MRLAKLRLFPNKSQFAGAFIFRWKKIIRIECQPSVGGAGTYTERTGRTVDDRHFRYIPRSSANAHRESLRIVGHSKSSKFSHTQRVDETQFGSTVYPIVTWPRCDSEDSATIRTARWARFDTVDFTCHSPPSVHFESRRHFHIGPVDSTCVRQRRAECFARETVAYSANGVSSQSLGSNRLREHRRIVHSAEVHLMQFRSIVSTSRFGRCDLIANNWCEYSTGTCHSNNCIVGET